MADFDYNELGTKYVSMAIGRPTLGTGFLPEEAIETLSVVEALIRDAANRSHSNTNALEKLQCACERLEGTHLIAKRILNSIQHLPGRLSDVAQEAPCLITIADAEIFVDFSSLLYHAGSTLDILTLFIGKESGIGHSKFKGSRNAIYNLQPPDIRADYLWNDLSRFEDEFDDIFKLSDNNEFKSLRNYIAHENSVLGLSSYPFTAHCCTKKEGIIFDCELEITSASTGNKKVFPISTTTEKVVAYVSWIVCRTAINYLSRTKHGSILHNPTSLPNWGPEKFIPKWDSPLAIFSSYISADKSLPRFSVTKVTWNGFSIQNEHLKLDVQSKRVALIAE